MMMKKSLLTILLLCFSILIYAQITEVKGTVTFKTIQLKKGQTDTLVTKGARTLITLFNKDDSKLVSIAEDNGEYFFDLDKSTTPYTHIQFLNIEGGYITFPLTEINQPFFDVVITQTEGVENVSRNNSKQKQTTVSPQPIVEPTPAEVPQKIEKVETPIPVETIVEPKVVEEPKVIEELEEIEEPKPIEKPIITEEKKPTITDLLPEEPTEEAVDAETEKLNKELKELEEELKRLEKEKENNTEK